MRVAVWGLGHHAIDKILPAVSAAEGLRLYGVCSRNPRTVADCSHTWDCHGWTEPASMLGDPELEIVYVATPIGLHAEHGRAVLRAGKHLWCEKPLTSRLHDTFDLLEVSRSLGLSVCEGHMYLHHPQFSQLTRYLSDGGLGRILSIWCGFGIPRLAHPGFRADPTLGGGALLDVGCYPISAVLALFPEEVHEIKYARMSRRAEAAVDTDGYSVIELSNGAVATLEWRTHAAYRNEIRIWGDEGSVFTEKLFSKPAEYRPLFHLRDAQAVETIEHGEAANHFVLMLEAFIRLVDDGVAMESERRAIAQRAEVLDQVFTRSAAGSAPS